jgi:hypothetical protein
MTQFGLRLLAFLLVACDSINAFVVVRQHPSHSPVVVVEPTRTSICEDSAYRRLGPLFMGRAAAVRAKTKGKMDGLKAKTNGYYGKRIIMAVKVGGSADPEANTMLRDVIRAAKTNSVPVDVS